jgi:hypothetical protein
MTFLSTNTVKPKDPNAGFTRFLREVTDDRGHTTVLSTIPLKQLSTNTVKPKEFKFDPTVAARALNRGQRPEKGFAPLQTADMRDIEDNKKRLAISAEKKAAASLAKLSDKPAPKPRGRKATKKGK